MSDAVQPMATTTADHILDAALDVFAVHGFEKTSMADIARRAGLSRTSLYKYHRTKEEVFLALSRRINIQVEQAVIEAANRPARERIRAVVHARVGWIYDLLSRSAYGRELVDEKNRICGGQALAANDRFAQLLVRLISSETGDGKKEAERVCQVLLAGINGILGQAATREDMERLVDDFITIILRGLPR